MTNSYENLISKLSFEDARDNLRGVLRDTKLIYSDYFSELTNNQVYIKPENLQNTGSFKIRGAYNTVSKLSDSDKEKGIIASSAGNHAQGVAYAANELGVKSTIVMPETTPLIKVNSTKGYGGNVVLHGNCYDDAYEKAWELKKEHGYTFIHPFNDINVVEGQGTISLEILEELPDADYILVPIGGGGLVSGVALAAKSINPNIKVIGVEPENAPSMIESLKQDKVVTLDSVNTIADGTAVKTPGNLNYYITKNYVDEIVTVSDLEIMEVFIDLIQKHKIIAENSGSLSIAAIKKLNVEGKKIVPIISGGNIDILAVSSLIDKGLRSIGRVFEFGIEVANKPGELEKITSILNDLNVNIINFRTSHREAENIFTSVGLEFQVETDSLEHIEEISKSLEEHGYKLITFN